MYIIFDVISYYFCFLLQLNSFIDHVYQFAITSSCKKIWYKIEKQLSFNKIY